MIENSVLTKDSHNFSRHLRCSFEGEPVDSLYRFDALTGFGQRVEVHTDGSPRYNLKTGEMIATPCRIDRAVLQAGASDDERKAYWRFVDHLTLPVVEFDAEPAS